MDRFGDNVRMAIEEFNVNEGREFISISTGAFTPDLCFDMNALAILNDDTISSQMMPNHNNHANDNMAHIVAKANALREDPSHSVLVDGYLVDPFGNCCNLNNF